MDRQAKTGKYNCTLLVLLIFIEMFCIPQNMFAKTKPTFAYDTNALFKRAQKLNSGMNISWLEQTWNSKILNDSVISNSDFILLKKLGFSTIRLPVAFTYFEDKKIPLTQVFKLIHKVLRLCKEHD